MNAPAPHEYPRPRQAWYAVAVLTLAYVFAFADRQLLNLLVGPIRRDLGISDTQMSLLMGFTFALFFSVFGILLGRVADTRSRRGLIAAGMVAWSLLTAGCALARRFWQMALLRTGVAVGEATLNPAAFSMIADYFPPTARATALGVYGMGIYLGAGLAYIGGGLVVGWASATDSLVLPVIGAVRSWQAAFFIVGIPGAFVAALLATVREPERKDVRASGAIATPAEVWAYLKRNRVTLACHHLGFGLLALSAYGAGAWIPTFFTRTYGWTGARPGLVQGIITAVCGTAGIVIAGRITDGLVRRGVRDAALKVGIAAGLACLPGAILYPLMPTGFLAAALLVPFAFFIAWPFGVAIAALQQMMPNEMRGQASAVYLFVLNLVGLGLGPTAVAAATDYLFRDDAAVRFALVLVAVPAHLGAVALLWMGLRPFRESLDRLEDRNPLPSRGMPPRH